MGRHEGGIEPERQCNQAHLDQPARSEGQGQGADRKIGEGGEPEREGEAAQHQDYRGARADRGDAKDEGRGGAREAAADAGADDHLGDGDQEKGRRGLGHPGQVHRSADHHRADEGGRGKPDPARDQVADDPAGGQQGDLIQDEGIEEVARRRPARALDAERRAQTDRQRHDHQQQAGGMNQGDLPGVAAHRAAGDDHLGEAARHGREVGGGTVEALEAAEVEIAEAAGDDDVEQQR